MYIIKNAYTNVIKSKGRNIMIGLIITVITIGACVSLIINKSGNALVDNYKSNNLIEVTLKLDSMTLKDATDEEKESFNVLELDDYESFGDSKYVKDYYYTNEVSLSSNDIEPIEMNDLLKTSDELSEKRAEREEERERPDGIQMNMGDFRLTGYSDPAYIEMFISGDNKITDGSMFNKDEEGNVIVISSELAETNELELGDTISFYTTDEDTEYEFEIVGIFSNESDSTSDNFMGMNAMNSNNQMYTTINAMNEITDTEESDTKEFNSINVTYYLESTDDVEAFEAELRDKGLSDYYTISTNEDEITESLTPIKNLSSFSLTFLIIILVIGSIILGVINMINIRERKYEIGVLRAIGMSKTKVTLQLISEIFMVSIASLVVGTIIGIAVSQPVTNVVLKNEIESYENKETNIQNNFGSSEFKRPGFGGENSNKGTGFDFNIGVSSNTEYVKQLDISVDVITVLELLLVSVFLTVTFGIISVMFVNKYEPNKILQNR